MGHCWSQRPQPTATERHARDLSCNVLADVVRKSSQPSPGTATPHTHDQNEGYGRFCVALESILTKSHAEKLATWFNYTPVDIHKIEASEDPSRVFVRLMHGRGEISPTDISKLIQALKHRTISLDGVAGDVEKAFYSHLPQTEQTDQTASADDKTVFLDHLKERYKSQYNAVQPIPYIRERLVCVDKVFVEGGIEYFIVNERTGICEGWGKLNSYQAIFRDPTVYSVRRILEGEPGFGKSTLTLQVVYDWCNDIPESVSDKYEILILLRLKQLGGVKSIFEAIRRFILPKDTDLSEEDIKNILKASKSVLVILDGFDEYPDQDDDGTSDVWRIIKMDMFQIIDVLLTTRTACLPTDYASQTKRIRLTGFDETAQQDYIRKVMEGNNGIMDVKAIKQQIIENAVIGDLCQVPLFFVLFVHMSCDSKHSLQFKSVTSFFSYVIKCFHHHMRNKLNAENVQRFESFEEDHRKLDKAAFEGLCNKNQQLLWGKEEWSKRLGEDFYNMYVRIGILVEEDVLDTESCLASNFIQEKTEVRFYHKLFCEWYAAHYLSSYAGRSNVRYMGNEPQRLYHSFRGRKDISRILRKLDPFDLQYVFRFACGLNPDASTKIIDHLKNKTQEYHFAILCILEKEGKVETILDSVRSICSSKVQINNSHTLLLQRSTIQLLEIASNNDIPISRVWLNNCFSVVDRPKNQLQLKANLSAGLPVLTTLQMLWIEEPGREISSDDFAGILHYSSKCLALKKVEFRWCLLPKAIQDESVSELRLRNVKVIWYPRLFAEHQLNLQSCQWESTAFFGGGVMSDEDYQNEVTSFNKKWTST